MLTHITSHHITEALCVLVVRSERSSPAEILWVAHRSGSSRLVAASKRKAPRLGMRLQPGRYTGGRMPACSVTRLFQRAAIALGRSRPGCDRANDNRNDPEHEHNCEINGHERPPVCAATIHDARQPNPGMREHG